MRKKAAALFIISLLLMAWAPGCTRSDYETYMAASERTDNVARGKSEMKMGIKLKFNKEGLSGETLEGLGMFEDLAFELRSEFDRDREENLSRIFAQAKDTGLDAKIYTRGGLVYVITPLIPKILVIKGEGLIDTDWAAGNREKMPVPSAESLVDIEKIWKSLYSDDNVSALEKIVLDTPEGSVKATKYMANVTDEQLKPALKKTMEILMQDRAFMEGMEGIMRTAMEKFAHGENVQDGAGSQPDEDNFFPQGFSFEEAMRANMQAMENATVKTFSQTAFIDRDNYIIEERLSMDILFHFTEAGAPRSYSMEMTIKNWDLNRAQEIYFPEVTAENSITLDELEDEYPGGLNLFRREAD